MESAEFVVGIDLGTTHSAMAAAPLDAPHLLLQPLTQLLAPGELVNSELLPSFLYLPAPGEFNEDETRLPWGSAAHIVGRFARQHGAKNPNRLVASAKSWICHGGVNRRTPILPWSAPDQEPHVSPFDAQVAYLTHLRQCWNLKHPRAAIEQQVVVVTVPASFDESARTLTYEAAQQAGLGSVRLLEEPQAAFYDYLGSLADNENANSAKESQQLGRARLILVVDVGGGTTDLTLLRVLPEAQPGSDALPLVERIAVGGHLMLGGDNMDAALAVFALNKAGLAQPSDPTTWAALVHAARDAKEKLLALSAPAEATLSYQGRGSKLIGNTKSIVITREEATQVLLDGCFPITGPADVAQRAARAGLTTLGLPYSSDTAVPRHICSFLRKHAVAAQDAGAQLVDGLPCPDLVLLNGGVFQAAAITSRIEQVMRGWFPEAPPRFLEPTSLDTSVARGATRFGLALQGIGRVIQGGTAKAYYVGVEQEGETKALCIAPRGLETDSRIPLPERLFQLRLNEPVSFPLFVYTGDRIDPAGTLLELAQNAEELEPMPPLQTLLRGNKGARESTVSVSLQSELDSSGNLQLSLLSVELPPRRWKLEFALRESTLLMGSASTPPQASAAQPAEMPPTEPLELPKPDPKANDAARLVATALNSGREDAVSALRRALEELLGERGQWSASTCRVLADALLLAEPARGHSEEVELGWLRLLSWCLRPGFGVRGDTARMEQLWRLHQAGPAFASKGNWGEWWILWRRVAPGLNVTQQKQLFEQVAPGLWPQGKTQNQDGPAVRLPPPQGPIEMMRMLAALERIPAENKERCGKLFIERSKKLGSYWPLGRVGARVLFHGPAHSIVSRGLAEEWLTHLLSLDWKTSEGAAFAAASLARLTSDDSLNVSEALRKQVSERLHDIAATPSWIDMVLRPTDLGTADVKRLLGDSLPVGLRLD